MITFVPFPDVDLQHRSIGRRGTQADAVPVSKMLADVTTNVNGMFEEGRNLAHYVDFRWLPARKRNLHYRGGCSESSGGISPAFSALSTFCQRSACSIVVMRKGSVSRSTLPSCVSES